MCVCGAYQKTPTLYHNASDFVPKHPAAGTKIPPKMYQKNPKMYQKNPLLTLPEWTPTKLDLGIRFFLGGEANSSEDAPNTLLGSHTPLTPKWVSKKNPRN